MEPIDDLDQRIFAQWDAYVTRSARVPSPVRKWTLAALAGATTVLLGTGVVALRAPADQPTAEQVVPVATPTAPDGCESPAG